MTFSYNLVLALFLLAPGFATYAGLFLTPQGDRRLHPAPPAPGSVITLALVTLAALLLHGCFAILLSVVSDAPSVYAILLESSGPATGAAGPFGDALAAFLGALLLLSALGYGLTVWIVGFASKLKPLQGFLYGWAATLVDQIREEEHGYVRLVTTFVLTNIEREGVLFGYEGLLQNMSLNSDKEVISLNLTNVTAFYVKAAPGQYKRVILPRAESIPNLYLERAHIRNLSFQVYRDRAPTVIDSALTRDLMYRGRNLHSTEPETTGSRPAA